MNRPLHEIIADHEPHIVAGLGIIIGAIAVSAIFYVAVIPAIDALAQWGVK